MEQKDLKVKDIYKKLHFLQLRHRIGLRGRLPVFVSEYLRDRRIQVRICLKAVSWYTHQACVG